MFSPFRLEGQLSEMRMLVVSLANGSQYSGEWVLREGRLAAAGLGSRVLTQLWLCQVAA